MKIILAPDKFKNSLTGMEFCNAVEAGLQEVHSDIEIIKLPLADGGDGTIEVVNHYLKGQIVNVQVNNPFFKPVKASYLYAESSKTAFLEMAEASGVKLLRTEQFDCKNATSLGTGEMIADAIDKGAKKIILGIGGSATNDCGIGMATALGYGFLDSNNEEVITVGASLSAIKSIDISKVNPKLFDIEFSIACDVSNPLYGENGAAQVYGSQKGASSKDIKMLDQGLRDFSEILNIQYDIDVQNVKGAGAAGGMGIAALLFLKGQLNPGIQIIKELANFDHQISECDWIITGEGKLDRQTLSRKTIQGVLSSAKAKNIKVAAFCGAIDLDKNAVQNIGIDYADAVLNHTNSLEDAMINGYNYVREMAKIFAITLA